MVNPLHNGLAGTFVPAVESLLDRLGSGVVDMKVVGTRKTRIVGGAASGDALRAGAWFNDEIHRLPTGSTTHLPRGVYRFRTHEDANRFDLDCLAKHMGRIARERMANGNG